MPRFAAPTLRLACATWSVSGPTPRAAPRRAPAKADSTEKAGACWALWHQQLVLVPFTPPSSAALTPEAFA